MPRELQCGCGHRYVGDDVYGCANCNGDDGPARPVRYSITVPGQPIGKARARTVRLPNGQVRSYTPAKTKSWETCAASEARQQLGPHYKTMTGPVELTVIAYMEIPTSWPPWKREAAINQEIHPTSKPDLDNIVKAAKDAMNGILWVDDCQVVYTGSGQRYSEEPRLVIDVQPISGAPCQIRRKAELQQWKG